MCPGSGMPVMGMQLLVLALPSAVWAADTTPVGGGACTTARDCQLAGLCTNSKCVCDPGWAVRRTRNLAQALRPQPRILLSI
jgi:hypothetical protein